MDTTHDALPPVFAHNTLSSILPQRTPSPALTEQQAFPSLGLSYASDPEDNMDVALPNNQVDSSLAGPEVSTYYLNQLIYINFELSSMMLRMVHWLLGVFASTAI